MEKPSDLIVGQIKQAAENPRPLSPEQKEAIIGELKAFSLEVERIDKTFKAGDLESWIAPEGLDGRTWRQEISYAGKNRERGYVPQLSYPALARGFLDPENPEAKLDIGGGLQALQVLKENLQTQFGNISPIASQMIERKEREFKFLQAVRDGDHQAAIENMPHGKPSEELVAYAQAAYDKDLQPKPKRNATARKLADNKITSDELKEYFEYAMQLLGAKDWRVRIVPKQGSITVYPEGREVKIPPRREYSGIRVLSLIAHEIGAHVGTSHNSEQNGFGSVSLGTETDVLQEGLAKLAEREVEAIILGYETNPGPYYVLGIQKAIETNGDFWAVYDYLITLRRDELTAQGRESDYIEKNVKDVPLQTLRRIFRGAVDLSAGEYVYTKDKAYLEGEMIAEKIKEAGLLGYMLAGKYDVPTAIFLLENGVTPPEAVKLTIDVARKIWAKEGDRDFLVNLNWYRENYNDPYWRESGITDEQYIEAMISRKPVKPKV